MIYYFASVGVSLIFLCLLWLAFNPFSPLRVVIYLGLAIGLMLVTVPWLDRLRDE